MSTVDLDRLAAIAFGEPEHYQVAMIVDGHAVWPTVPLCTRCRTGCSRCQKAERRLRDLEDGSIRAAQTIASMAATIDALRRAIDVLKFDQHGYRRRLFLARSRKP